MVLRHREPKSLHAVRANKGGASDKIASASVSHMPYTHTRRRLTRVKPCCGQKQPRSQFGVQLRAGLPFSRFVRCSHSIAGATSNRLYETLKK